MSGILDGVRVLDLTTGMAGPIAAMFLADAGADVIKVEPPEGDPLRGSVAFATWNRGKRSVVVDLGSPRDRTVLEQLLAETDVLVHGLDDDDASRLGLDAASVRRRWPHVIVCTVTGYARGHPDEGRPYSDILVQARTGLMAETFTRRPGPTFLRLPLPSWGAAYLACTGILTRLFVRERYGAVGPIHTSLHQGALLFLNSTWKSATRPSASLLQYLGIGKRPHPWMFVCADGRWIQPYVTFVESVPFVETLLSLGHVPPEVDLDPSEQDIRMFREVFATKTADEWVRELWEHDVDCEVMLHVGDVFQSEIALEADATVELADPVLGVVRESAAPFATEPPSRPSRPSPALGEHGDSIRADGWGSAGGAWKPPRRSESDGEAPEHPLTGIRVLDFGAWIAAPLCATFLGDLGADVVKIESPAGDPSRHGGDLFFLAGNRNKKSVVIDLRQAESRPIVTELIRGSDVVVHNVRPSKARGLGVDYESLRAVTPDVIACEMTAYSDRGPSAEVPGRDTLVGALSGWTLDGGDDVTGPIWLRMMVGDTATAAAGLIGTLLALYQREKTGRGSRASASLLRTACMYASEVLVQLENDRITPVTRGLPGAVGLAPTYRIYETAEGWLAVSTDAEALAELGRRLGVAPERLEEALASLSLDDAMSRLAAAGIAAEVIDHNPEASFFARRANADAGLVNVYEHADFGTVAHPFGYWQFESMSCVTGVPAPTLGQHTAAVLADLDVRRVATD